MVVVDGGWWMVVDGGGGWAAVVDGGWWMVVVRCGWVTVPLYPGLGRAREHHPFVFSLHVEGRIVGLER